MDYIVHQVLIGLCFNDWKRDLIVLKQNGKSWAASKDACDPKILL